MACREYLGLFSGVIFAGVVFHIGFNEFYKVDSGRKLLWAKNRVRYEYVSVPISLWTIVVYPEQTAVIHSSI